MMHSPPKPQRTRQVPAVTRAIAILQYLGKLDAPVGVNAIARKLELIPSTCLHILRVLAEEKLVEFDETTKRYSLGIGILPIARNAMLQNSFTQIVQPYLDRLSRDLGVTAIGVQVDDLTHMIVVAISKSPLPFRVQVDVGSRFPALISATGRCCAAFGGYTDADLQTHFDALQWDNPPSYSAWQAQVEETRTQKYGIDQGEYIRGVTIIAAPVLDAAKRFTQCIVAVGISEQMRGRKARDIAARTLDAAESVNAVQNGA